MAIETIPIPRTQARNADPIRVEVDDLYAWPGQRLVVLFRHNPHTNRWVWRLRHDSAAVGTLIERSVVTLDHTYWGAFPYMTAKFIDTAGDERAVVPRNLGDTVELAVFPGPRGGIFHPDANLDYETQNALVERMSRASNIPGYLRPPAGLNPDYAPVLAGAGEN